jgi:site-specific recombinase XerD
MHELTRWTTAEVTLDQSPNLQSPNPQSPNRAHFAQAMLQAQLANDEWMAVQWSNLHEAWLNFVAAKRSGSAHTETNYRRATRQWREFVATLRQEAGPDAGFPVKLWQVDAGHVRQWQAALAAAGNGDTTINLKLSAVSSFYSFIINERRMVGGVEMCLFADARGNARANPFRFGNVQRPKATTESVRAKPLQPAEIGKLFAWLQARQHTLTGARNYALILAYSETGFRNAEVIRMQWKHIRLAGQRRQSRRRTPPRHRLARHRPLPRAGRALAPRSAPPRTAPPAR